MENIKIEIDFTVGERKTLEKTIIPTELKIKIYNNTDNTIIIREHKIYIQKFLFWGVENIIDIPETILFPKLFVKINVKDISKYITYKDAHKRFKIIVTDFDFKTYSSKFFPFDKLLS